MKVVAIIPAKGKSRRLKRKNIYPVWGKPMIGWAIEACQKSKYEIEAWVSTEDSEIKDIALRYGAKVHDRELVLSQDHIYKQAVIRSAARHIFAKDKPDIVISLQANSPQIKAEHLNNAIEIMLKYKRDEIFSVDKNLMQNAAFRVFRGDYVFQEDLSTNCGVVVCELCDVHTADDINLLETNFGVIK
tara:strand:- start:107 stop:670 length:564 start_codon:yes stop_codon:yes gene_type:complete